MEAPEKIKIGKHNITSDGDVVFGWVANEPDCEAMQHDIEYTRTDAFIEKSCKFFGEHLWEYINVKNANCDTFINIDGNKLEEDFKNYMKGE